MLRWVAVVGLLAAGVVSPLFGAAELITDRPDQTESAALLPKGTFQIETGWLHTETDSAGVDFEADAIGGTLLRIGIMKSIELRVGHDGWIDERVSGPGGSTGDDGVGDLSIGAKLALWEEEGPQPQAAIIGMLTLPTGSDGFGSERADPSFRLAFANALSETLSLGYNLGMSWETVVDGMGGEDTVSFLDWTVVLGIGATDRVGFFVEGFGQSALSADGGPATSVDGGTTYLLNDRTQLDLSVGFGLSDAAPDWFVGAGISFRLPE